LPQNSNIPSNGSILQSKWCRCKKTLTVLVFSIIAKVIYAWKCLCFDLLHYIELSENDEIQISEELEIEIITTRNKSSKSLQKSTINNKENVNSLSKSRRRCTINQIWLKDPKYSAIVKEFQTNSYLVQSFICKPNFPISNGDIDKINWDDKPTSHKRFIESQA